jgi:hypothetical protein
MRTLAAVYAEVKVSPLGPVAGTDGDDQVAAGDDHPGEGAGYLAGGRGVGEVQHGGEDHPGGLGQVDQAGQPGIGQDAPGVDELADALHRHVVDGAPEEQPVLPGHLRRRRVDGQHLFGQFAVGGEVVLPAQTWGGSAGKTESQTRAMFGLAGSNGSTALPPLGRKRADLPSNGCIGRCLSKHHIPAPVAWDRAARCTVRDGPRRAAPKTRPGSVSAASMQPPQGEGSAAGSRRLRSESTE